MEYVSGKKLERTEVTFTFADGKAERLYLYAENSEELRNELWNALGLANASVVAERKHGKRGRPPKAKTEETVAS